ncbi:MAG: HIT domain-containing protein [Candidatus Pacebacteria bacterium]|nr:HIT domain-containing protein [Candidatus Paceibacterota bacterium]
MLDCLFCKIAKKEIKSEIIYEDADNLSILDIHPVAPGHTMTISKTHSENLLDLPDNKVGSLFLAVKKVTDMLKKALNPDAFTIGINNGKYSGQAIDHLHVHSIPRFKNDGGSSVHSVVSNPPPENIQTLANLIRKG